MSHWARIGSIVMLLVAAAGVALAQESPAAKSARKRLQQKIAEVEWKNTGTKPIFDDLKREMDMPVSFKIDNASGVSNNTKLTYSAKNKTVEEILNGLCDKGEFGWYVLSNPKDRYDGWVIIRKHKEKERGYEGGKKP
ncbi:MAG: hypothetical protein L0Y72_10870 [Gemmataceae bacterium]|nr:hypothetical protein [Gemmataceae bacterium]MCI0739537.1 hypothetical protein [Gemmataceae bacterium]